MSEPVHSRTDAIAGSVLAVASAAAIFWMVPSFVDGPMTEGQFSPRFFPTFALSVVLGLSLVLAVQGLTRLQQDAPAAATAGPVIQTATWALFSALLLAGVTHAGFIITGIAVVLIWGLAAGGRNLKILVPAGFLLPPLVAFAVQAAFGVQLP